MQAGLKLIQLLPINDTTATKTWLDSYPYAAISIFALHPIYLDVRALSNTEKVRHLLQTLEPHRRHLNELETVDYEAVMEAKWKIIHALYPEEKDKTFASTAYIDFFKDNQSWLVPYACFCHLRDKRGSVDFNKWPENQFSSALAAALENSAADALGVYYYIQFHLHLQLKAAVKFAHQHQVVLKGDIAIGVYKNSVDVWKDPELFHTEAQAGAPPDDFTLSGQNWGFPTYNWQQMKARGYDWWRSRLQHMETYFDATRIDHILGFFRIWSIPVTAVEGILGYFQPAIPVSEAELRAAGAHFPLSRLYEPYIHLTELKETFADSIDQIASTFLDGLEEGCFQFKTAFDSQRKVQEYFDGLEKSTYNKWLLQALLSLHANVVLLKDEQHPGAYHFRFNMQFTSAFKRLNNAVKDQLNNCYHDYFFIRQNQLWKNEAMEKLPAIKNASNMLICGEDLGFTPNSVPEVMHNLGLLGLYVQRMPKQLGQGAEDLSSVPYLSVVSPSTHDTSSIRGWWLGLNRHQAQTFYNEVLHQPGDAPGGQDLPGWLGKMIIETHLSSPAMWSIFLLQDLLNMNDSLHIPSADNEQINHPENPRQYWRYRMNVTLEQLMELTAFNQSLLELVRSHGR